MCKKPPAGCALARRGRLSQATALGARMCFAHSVFYKYKIEHRMIFPGCRFKNIDVVKNNCVKTELTVDKEVYIVNYPDP